MILRFLLLWLPIALCTGDDLMDFPGCPGRDRCSDMSISAQYDIRERNCECDSDCVDYGDCCQDYPRDDARQKKNISDRPMRCVEFDTGPTNMGLYMVVDCPTGTEPNLRAECEAKYDPITLFPNGPTYLNYHCALCNGQVSPIRWHYDAECELALWPYYLSKGFYSTFRDGWAVMLDSKRYTCYLRFNFSTLAPHSSIRPIDVRSPEQDDLEGSDDSNMDISEVARRSPKFKLSDLIAKYSKVGKLASKVGKLASKVGKRDIPPDLGRLRLCRPYLVSECPQDYSDERVREACTGGYEAAVYGLRRAYRNPHCALCHGEDLRTLVCDPSEADMGRR